MDADRSRLFLLSILTVPAACGPGVPGGNASTAPLPTDDDEGLEPEDPGDGPGPDTQGCEAFFAALAGCYTPDAPYETGYDYGDGGAYVPTPDLADYCAYLDYVADVYGPDCARAIDDALACMASFACQVLDQGGLEELCADAVARAEAYCPVGEPDVPEQTGVTGSDTSPNSTTGSEDTGGADGCGEPDVFTDGSTCVAQYQDCADGNAYEVTCTPGVDGGLHSCVCTMNGGQTMTFETENPCTGAYETLASTQCGFGV